MEKKANSVFNKTNFLIIGLGAALIVVGFLLMAGPATTFEHFETDIFSARRIRVAPLVTLAGFVSIIFGILYGGKNKAA